ncbi:hypothetical protein CC79DRAFT_41748 [Sarocladium strictum]
MGTPSWGSIWRILNGWLVGMGAALESFSAGPLLHLQLHHPSSHLHCDGFPIPCHLGLVVSCLALCGPSSKLNSVQLNPVRCCPDSRLPNIEPCLFTTTAQRPSHQLTLCFLPSNLVSHHSSATFRGLLRTATTESRRQSGLLFRYRQLIDVVCFPFIH